MIANSVGWEIASVGGSAGAFPMPVQGQRTDVFDQLKPHCNAWPHRTKFSPGLVQRSARIGQLYCMTGYLLNIHQDGTVDGNLKDHDPFGVLEFITVAFGLVSIRGQVTNHYLCMNKRGRVYTSPNQTFECIFKETMLETYYNNYASCAYSSVERPWYLSVSRRGKARRGRKTKRRRLPKRTQFLVMLLDDAKLDISSVKLKQSGWRKKVFYNATSGDGRDEQKGKDKHNNAIVIRNSRFGVDQVTAQWRNYFLSRRSDTTLYQPADNRRLKHRRKGRRGSRGRKRKRKQRKEDDRQFLIQ